MELGDRGPSFPAAGLYLLPTESQEAELLHRVVEAGGVDGCTKEHTETVDHLSLAVHLSVLRSVSQALTAQMEECVTVGTYIHACVLTFQILYPFPGKPVPGFPGQRTVVDKQKDPCLFPHGVYRKTAGRIGLPRGS